MTEPLVRGYWITGAVAFLGARHSPETTERLLSGLPRGLRGSIVHLGPAEWCPRSHHVELMKAMTGLHTSEMRAYDDLLGYGQYVGNEISQGALRPFFTISPLKLFARKLPTLWSRDHQGDGKLESDFGQVDEGRIPLKLSGMGGYDHVGIAALGWIKGLMTGYDLKGVRVKQSGWSLANGAPDELTCEVVWS